MPTAGRAPSRRRLGALAAAAAGAAALVAATPAVAQDTKTIQVPAMLHIEWQEDPAGPGEVYSNCTSVAIIRWQAVPNAIEGKDRFAYYTSTLSTLPESRKRAHEPFPEDTFKPGGIRDFSAPSGYHQVVLTHNSKSVPNAPANCSAFTADYEARYKALRVEVQVPADAPATTPAVEPGPETTPEGETPEAEVERTRYKPLLTAKWGKRTVRLNRTRRVPYNAPIVLRGRTRPALKSTRLLVQRRVIVRTKKRTTVRWKTIRRVRTTSKGTFRWVYRARKLGRDTLRITAPSSKTRLSAHSGQVRLNVVRLKRG